MNEELYNDTLFELQRVFSFNLDILTDYLEQGHTLNINEDLSPEENADQNFFDIIEETAV